MNKKITSIEIRNQSNGIYNSDEIVAEAVKIYDNNKIRHTQYNGWSDNPVNVYEYEVNNDILDKFFDKLINEIKVDVWEDEYIVEVFDGWSWEIKIRFSDNSIKKIVGTVVLSPMSYRLKDEIFKLCDFNVKPWIL